jgi:hypothetical protein
MNLHDEYRKHAADSLKLASKQPDDAQKCHLVAMAEAWLELADRLAARPKKDPAAADHPLVEQVLGPEEPDGN